MIDKKSLHCMKIARSLFCFSVLFCFACLLACVRVCLFVFVQVCFLTRSLHDSNLKPFEGISTYKTPKR